MKYKIQMKNLLVLLQNYDGRIPFAVYFKKTCANNKGWGSKDRKFYRQAAYVWFRACIQSEGHIDAQKWCAAYYLVSTEISEFYEYWIKELALESFYLQVDKNEVQKKQKLIEVGVKFLKLEWLDYLSQNVDLQKWMQAHLIQPFVWVRINKKEREVFQKSQLHLEAVMDCEQFAYAYPSQFDLQVENQKLFEVQDLSSQKCGRAFAQFLQGEEKIWDCCAASGGKSLLIYDERPNVEIFVSDVRTQTLSELHQRFIRNEIHQYAYVQINLEVTQTHIEFKESRKSENRTVNFNYFDVVMADVPCSGSGTWKRDPENLHFFKKEKILDYTNLQRRILRNAIPFLKQNGKIFYSTCSVFRAENEDQVEWMCREFGFECVGSSLEQGALWRADDLFWAILKKV